MSSAHLTVLDCFTWVPNGNRRAGLLFPHLHLCVLMQDYICPDPGHLHGPHSSPVSYGRYKPLFANILAAGLPVSDNCSAMGAQPELVPHGPQHLPSLPSAWRGALKHRLQANTEKPTLPCKPSSRIETSKAANSTMPISPSQTAQRGWRL